MFDVSVGMIADSEVLRGRLVPVKGKTASGSSLVSVLDPELEASFLVEVGSMVRAVCCQP